MSVTFSRARGTDLAAVCDLYQATIADMQARGMRQWQWGDYPSPELLADDAAAGTLYVGREDDRLIGAFVVNEEIDPQYRKLTWRYGVRPAMLHLVAILPDAQHRGVGAKALATAMDAARALGCDCLRLDTSCRNEYGLALYRRHMRREGARFFFDDDEPYVSFETPLTDDCPLLPIPMRPAFRFGAQTPWGGDGLKTAFHKDIPDPRTGESLEVSALPELESTDPNGEPLTKLLAELGRELTGDAADPARFPLLLKLLNARETLSVQVHPDDDYARVNEGGKQGKAEAWVILDAAPDASLVYGLAEGVTRGKLAHAALHGEPLLPLLRCVPVRAGDVFNIPAGTVHGIGRGITLYEIQQSSDVTYRLYDYNRRDAQGRARALHIDKACDVLREDTSGDFPSLPAAEGLHGVLDTPAFSLSVMNVSGAYEFRKRRDAFTILTALSSLLLSWEGDALMLARGETVLLPAACPPLSVRGVGRALLAEPPVGDDRGRLTREET